MLQPEAQPAATAGPFIALRDATDADMARVREIYAYYVTNSTSSFELAAPSVDEMRRRRLAVLEQGLPFIVAEVDGVIQAYGYASPFRSRPGYRFAVEDSVYVAKGMNGKGFGRAILDELIRRCTAIGKRQMLAVIGHLGSDVNEASLALHQRAGFVRVGHLKSVGYKLGQWVDAIIMQRALGEGMSTPPRDD